MPIDTARPVPQKIRHIRASGVNALYASMSVAWADDSVICAFENEEHCKKEGIRTLVDVLTERKVELGTRSGPQPRPRD